MKGLEITELRLSDLWTENPTGRFDSEYFQKVYLKNIATIKKFPAGWMRLGDAISELTGGATPLGADYPESGVRFLRVQNVMQNFIDDSDLAFISPDDDNALSRSRLKKDDVLLTITGVSYGKSAVVTPEFVGSNINQHSVRIKLQQGAFESFFISTFLNSRNGKLQSDQNKTGIERPALDYQAIRRFHVPLVSNKVQIAVARTVEIAQQEFGNAKQRLTEAEQVLVTALGLSSWQSPEPLTYTRRVSEAFVSGRLDAEFFQPRYDALRTKLKKAVSLMPLEKFGEVAENDFQADPAKKYNYTEISDVSTSNGAVIANELLGSEMPANAKVSLKGGELLASKVRPTRGAVGIAPEGPIFNHVASSAFFVLRVPSPAREYLQVFLRSKPGKLLLEEYCKGSSYPVLDDADIHNVSIPVCSNEIMKQIQNCVSAAHAARQRAQALLAAAQRAVEIAIEDSETAALAYLKKQSA